MAVELKQQTEGYVPAKGEDKMHHWPFDSFAWWDPMHSNRIVSQLINETLGYCDARMHDSTGEYVGGLLQFMEEGDQLIIHTVVEGVRTTTYAFRSPTEDEEEHTENLVAGRIMCAGTFSAELRIPNVSCADERRRVDRRQAERMVFTAHT